MASKKRAKKGVTRKPAPSKKRDRSWVASILAVTEVGVLLRLAIAIGFTASIIWLASIPAHDSQPSPSSASLQHKNSGNEGRDEIDGLSYNDFTFYSKLRDFKIEVSLDQSDTGPSYTTQYLIQAGAFKSFDRAEEQLVSLTLLDLDPTIEEDKGWYRVLIGPLKTRGSMTAARERLLENGVEAQVLTEKTPISAKN